jgi:hypothetical protein
MSRKIDPAEAAVMLKEHQPNFDRLKAAEAADSFKWQDEIAMLERRVHDCYEDVDLGNGDTIAVRTALSEEEMQEMNALEQRKTELEKKDPELSEITYRQLELMTANPYLTAQWFSENKAKWPVDAALAVLQSFLEHQISKRINRVKDLQSFRDQ